jgi:hypothetical protein
MFAYVWIHTYTHTYTYTYMTYTYTYVWLSVTKVLTILPTAFAYSLKTPATCIDICTITACDKGKPHLDDELLLEELDDELLLEELDEDEELEEDELPSFSVSKRFYV